MIEEEEDLRLGKMRVVTWSYHAVEKLGDFFAYFATFAAKKR